MFSFKSWRQESKGGVPKAIAIDRALEQASLFTDAELLDALKVFTYHLEDRGGSTVVTEESVKTIEDILAQYDIKLERPEPPATSVTASQSWSDIEWRIYTIQVFTNQYAKYLDGITPAPREQERA